MTEWEALLADLLERVTARWPGLDVQCGDHGTLSVRAPDAMSGAVRLDISRDDDDLHMVPRISVGSSSAYPSAITVALAQHREAGRVLEALHYLARETDGRQIYPDGKCPCAKCGGSGNAFRSSNPCDACGGEGRR